MPTPAEISKLRFLNKQYEQAEKKYQESLKEEKRLLAELGETPESAMKELDRLRKVQGELKADLQSSKGGILNVSSSAGYGKGGGSDKEEKSNNWGQYEDQLSKSQLKKLQKKYGKHLKSNEKKKVEKYIKSHSGDSTNTMAKALNRDQLAALKAVRPDVAAHKTYGKNSKGLLDWWKKYGSKDEGLLQKVNDYVVKTGGSIGGASSQDLSSPTYDLENDPNYQALPDELKKVAAFFENAGMASNTEQGVKLIQSLQTAASQSDVYMKQFFRIAEDTMIRTSDEYSAAFGNQSEILNKRILELQEDLSKNKEFLTLEEQSDMTRMASNYKFNLQATQGTMAAAGLAQSTIRSEAETRLAEQNKGLVEDTQRQYSKRIEELETGAARGSTQARTELDELQRTLGLNLTKLGRSTEIMMGSENMPALAGYNPLGNITGKLPEQQTGDTMARASALLGEAKQESLNLTY